MPKEKEKPLEERLLSKDTTLARIWSDDRDRLIDLKKRMGFKNTANVLRYLLRTQRPRPPTFEDVMKTKEKEEEAKRVPVVITGEPWIGKTHFIKHKILPKLNPETPVLVIDSWDEYRELEKKDDVTGLDFENFKGHIRFVPNKQSAVAVTQVDLLFSNLDLKREKLERWVIVVEEAHAFKNVPSFMRFLYGARHFVRKMVVITPQTDAFQGLETFTVYREKD